METGIPVMFSISSVMLRWWHIAQIGAVLPLANPPITKNIVQQILLNPS